MNKAMLDALAAVRNGALASSVGYPYVATDEQGRPFLTSVGKSLLAQLEREEREEAEEDLRQTRPLPPRNDEEQGRSRGCRR